MEQSVAVLLHDGFEEVEAVTPIDLLNRAGLDVLQVGIDVEERGLVTGKNGITLQVGHALPDVEERAFDAVVLPGGPGIKAIRGHAGICALLKAHAASGRVVGCICAAPLLLLDAGLLPGIPYTCHPSAEEELPEAEPMPVVRHQNLITSRGAGTATEFSLELIRALVGTEAASKTAASICWPHGA